MCGFLSFRYCLPHEIDDQALPKPRSVIGVLMPLYALLIVALSIAAFSLICSAFIVFSQHWHGKVSHDHNLLGVQKFHTAAVPRVGGIAIVVGMGLGLGCTALFDPSIVARAEMRYVVL